MNVIVPQYIKANQFFIDNPTLQGYAKLLKVKYGASEQVLHPTSNIWNISTTYAKDAIVNYMPAKGTRDEGIWKQYKAIVSNTGQTPPEYGLSAYWQDLGALDVYKAMDYYVNTTTSTSESSMTVEFLCRNITSIALINISANKVNIVGTTTYGETIINEELLIYEKTTNYTDYFFKDFVFSKDIAIPKNEIAGLFPNLTVTITFTGVTGMNISCGMIIPGRIYSIGRMQYAPQTGIKDFSKKITDDVFGETYLKTGNYKDTLEADLIIYNEDKNFVNNIMRSLRGKPTVFQGNTDDTDFDDLLLFGFIDKFRMIHQAAKYSEMSLTLEGLI